MIFYILIEFGHDHAFLMFIARVLSKINIMYVRSFRNKIYNENNG